MRITILGAGAWGTALAIALAERHAVVLWGREIVHLERLHQEHENRRYLPGISLPSTLTYQADLARACADSDLAIVAVPLAALDGIMAQLVAERTDLPVLWACKGIEIQSGRLPHQIVQTHIPHHQQWGVLSGPSFATEVAAGLPTALTLASMSPLFSRTMSENLHSPRLRLYSCRDIVGVEVAGALKKCHGHCQRISRWT